MSGEAKKLTMRPYARLLSMLGDQLIKNEVIALTEIIKNSYDADASRVRVFFQGFDDDGRNTDGSKIIIIDDGCGMTQETIEKDWLNPATPNKKLAKIEGGRSSKGRIVQGEKGIGRFAVFKLGKTISVCSRRCDFACTSAECDACDYESYLTYDFSKYDDDYLTDNNQALFLDDLTVDLKIERPPLFFSEKSNDSLSQYGLRTSHGTCIEIGGLRGNWTRSKMENVLLQVSKMRPIFEEDGNESFSIHFYLNDLNQVLKSRWNTDRLLQLLDEKSVLSVREGVFDQETGSFNFLLNNKPHTLSLDSAELKGLSIYRDYVESQGYPIDNFSWRHVFSPGSFSFRFDIFDLSQSALPRYMLDREEKDVIRSHRVYLYRDGIRVMPYGDPDDDWLSIDVIRGTKRASSFFSNDQIVGCVDISQKDNPQLKDKTNREGLIEEGNSVRAFITLIQIVLSWLRAHPYQQYKMGIESRKKADLIRRGRPKGIFDDIENAAPDNKKVKSLVSELRRSYDKEISVLTSRIDRTENLAAVGLSVETASHDLMLVLGRALTNLDGVISEIEHMVDFDSDHTLNELYAIRGQLSMVHDQMKDIQLIYPSTKTRAKMIDLATYVNKVYSIYKRTLGKYEIEVNIEKEGSPLRAKTTEAVILQVLINLFDNALYWLQYSSTPRRILIKLDGGAQKLVFSDNGSGVSKDDAPYIFDSFYSGKGEEGRGLGLYIARQLLGRYGYSIRLSERSEEALLDGATFVVEFVSEGGASNE